MPYFRVFVVEDNGVIGLWRAGMLSGIGRDMGANNATVR